MPEISVIMLTHNRENLVVKVIESILKQTFSGFEFIIIDNGSTDASGAIDDNYVLKDSCVKVIHIGSGCNTGLLAARGKYISFIDDGVAWTQRGTKVLLKPIGQAAKRCGMCGRTEQYDANV